MGRRPAPKPDDTEQSKRFIKTAKEAEADDTEALDRALKKVAQIAKRQKSAEPRG